MDNGSAQTRTKRWTSILYAYTKEKKKLNVKCLALDGCIVPRNVTSASVVRQTSPEKEKERKKRKKKNKRTTTLNQTTICVTHQKERRGGREM